MSRSDRAPTERRTDGTVELATYDPDWPSLFDKERVLLVEAIPQALSIEHIGSTAVPGLASKPTIDILAVVTSIADVVPAQLDALHALGYDYRGPFTGEESTHVFLRKVNQGKRTHHLHVLAHSSHEPARYRLFRDFLIAVPSAAARYEAHKWKLIDQFGRDGRAAYVTSKGTFVDTLMLEAIAWRDSGHAMDNEPQPRRAQGHRP